jgi:hypothetical protein
MAILTAPGGETLVDELGQPLTDGEPAGDQTVLLSLLTDADAVFAPAVAGGAVPAPSPYRYVAFRI